MSSGTIVVAGALARNPGHGGHAWVLLQYVFGFQRLGWNVTFLDRLEPEVCVDERGRPCPVDRSVNVRTLKMIMDGFGLAENFAIICSGGDTSLGLSRREVLERTRHSALLLNVMGCLDDEEILEAAPLTVFLDIDPGFAQMWHELRLADPFRGHDRFVTTGENVGNPGCPIPECGLDWITTPPPVVRSLWARGGMELPAAPGPFTSVMFGRRPTGSVQIPQPVTSLQLHGLRRFVSLPRRTGQRFELALPLDPADEEDHALLAGNGWTIMDHREMTGDPWGHRSFIRRSGAAFAVANNLYVDMRNGWLSDQSLCYLACGKPVVAQDTGFSRKYPVGEGLLSFGTVEEACASVERVCGDYKRHSAAARELAAEYFDSDRVLGGLLERLDRE